MSGVVSGSSASSSNSSSDLSQSQSSIQQIISPLKGNRDMGAAGVEVDDTSKAEEYYCGIWKCRPRWIQVFRKGKFFTFILCLYCCIQGALVSGMLVV